VRAGFGATCFFAAVTAGDVAVAGRGAGNGVAFATDDGGDGGRGAGGVPGSGVMMLTGGIEVAVGNSALVGLPDGVDGASAATGVTAGAAIAGMFHDGA
jgi:hypothetical protein